MQIEFWKVAILKNLEHSVKIFYERVLIVTLQAHLVQLYSKKAFNWGDFRMTLPWNTRSGFKIFAITSIIGISWGRDAFDLVDVRYFKGVPSCLTRKLSLSLVSEKLEQSLGICFEKREGSKPQSVASKRSRWKMFFKIDDLKNFAIITGKHLCWSLFLKIWK